MHDSEHLEALRSAPGVDSAELRRETVQVVDFRTVRARPGRLRGLSVSHRKSVFYGAFVWARGALNSERRRFLAPPSR